MIHGVIGWATGRGEDRRCDVTGDAVGRYFLLSREGPACLVQPTGTPHDPEFDILQVLALVVKSCRSEDTRRS